MSALAVLDKDINKFMEYGFFNFLWKDWRYLEECVPTEM